MGPSPATGYGEAMRSTLAVLVITCLSACASSTRTITPDRGFVEKLGATHPLVGRIYAPDDRDWKTLDELAHAVRGAEVVVLGESHDNRDHHALEAKLVHMFLDAHPSAAIGFEMLDEDQRAALQTPPRDPDALAQAVRWEDSGWPEFSQYRPIFEVALAAGAPLIAAHPSRERVRASMSGVREDEARSLQLDRPLAPPAREQLEREIRDAHCGHANEAMITSMARAQSYKDAFMARALFEARRPTVLVAGRGHARTDRAVPYYLERFGARNVVSVALVEVEDAARDPRGYDVGSFDLVVFTPRTSDADPCQEFEEQLKKMRESRS